MRDLGGCIIPPEAIEYKKLSALTEYYGKKMDY